MAAHVLAHRDFRKPPRIETENDVFFELADASDSAAPAVLSFERNLSMDRKPWQNNGPHRASFGSERREGGRFSSDRRGGEGERDRGSRRFDREERREFGDRREFGGERRGFGERREFGGERRSFGGERRSFGDRAERRSFGDRSDRRASFGAPRRREDFGVRSGPRARALETRRFSERSDFAKSGVVKLDADLANYFENAEAVNKALRMLVESARLVKFPAPKTSEEKIDAVEKITPETAEAVFSDMDFVDDVEAESYGQALAAEEAVTADAEEEKKAE